MSGVSWDYYNKFSELNDKYLPDTGQGDTMATQIVTAVNKLIYRWYNDGDVFDNQIGLTGWENDLSSYANWLYNHVSTIKEILVVASITAFENVYEDCLKRLADILLDEKLLSELDKFPAKGNIYSETGKFKYIEYSEEDDY